MIMQRNSHGAALQCGHTWRSLLAAALMVCLPGARHSLTRLSARMCRRPWGCTCRHTLLSRPTHRRQQSVGKGTQAGRQLTYLEHAVIHQQLYAQRLHGAGEAAVVHLHHSLANGEHLDSSSSLYWQPNQPLHIATAKLT